MFVNFYSANNAEISSVQDTGLNVKSVPLTNTKKLVEGTISTIKDDYDAGVYYVDNPFKDGAVFVTSTVRLAYRFSSTVGCHFNSIEELQKTLKGLLR